MVPMNWGGTCEYNGTVTPILDTSLQLHHVIQKCTVAS